MSLLDVLHSLNARLCTEEKTSSLQALLGVCKDIIGSETLFRELLIPIALDVVVPDGMDVPAAPEHQRYLTQLLSGVCMAFESVGVAVAVVEDVGGWIPSALSQLALLTFERSTALAKLVPEALTAVWELHKSHVSPSEEEDVLLKWMLTTTIIQHSRHHVSAISLRRLCEKIALADNQSCREQWLDDSFAEALLETLRRVESGEAELMSARSMQWVLRRLIAFSLCGSARRSVIMESCGRFFSEVNRLGAHLVRLVTRYRYSLESVAIAATVWSILADDNALMFEAHPSAGEFFACMLQYLCASSTAASEPKVWHSAGVQRWYATSVLFNDSEACSEGAIAARLVAAVEYRETPESMSIFEAVNCCTSLPDKRLLDSGVSLVARDVAVRDAERLRIHWAATDEHISPHFPTDQDTRMSLSRVLTPVALLTATIRDGGSHRHASALLLLTEDVRLTTEDDAASPSNSTALRSTNVLCSLLRMLEAPSIPAKCLHLLLVSFTALLEAAWNQSPRDMAPHVAEGDIIRALHASAQRLGSSFVKCGSGGPSTDAQLSVGDAVYAIEECVHVTAEMVELHESVRTYVSQEPIAAAVAETCALRAELQDITNEHFRFMSDARRIGSALGSVFQRLLDSSLSQRLPIAVEAVTPDTSKTRAAELMIMARHAQLLALASTDDAIIAPRQNRLRRDMIELTLSHGLAEEVAAVCQAVVHASFPTEEFHEALLKLEDTEVMDRFVCHAHHTRGIFGVRSGDLQRTLRSLSHVLRVSSSVCERRLIDDTETLVESSRNLSLDGDWSSHLRHTVSVGKAVCSTEERRSLTALKFLNCVDLCVPPVVRACLDFTCEEAWRQLHTIVIAVVEADPAVKESQLALQVVLLYSTNVWQTEFSDESSSGSADALSAQLHHAESALAFVADISRVFGGWERVPDATARSVCRTLNVCLTFLTSMRVGTSTWSADVCRVSNLLCDAIQSRMQSATAVLTTFRHVLPSLEAMYITSWTLLDDRDIARSLADIVPSRTEISRSSGASHLTVDVWAGRLLPLLVAPQVVDLSHDNNAHHERTITLLLSAANATAVRCADTLEIFIEEHRQLSNAPAMSSWESLCILAQAFLLAQWRSTVASDDVAGSLDFVARARHAVTREAAACPLASALSSLSVTCDDDLLAKWDTDHFVELTIATVQLVTSWRERLIAATEEIPNESGEQELIGRLACRMLSNWSAAEPSCMKKVVDFLQEATYCLGYDWLDRRDVKLNETLWAPSPEAVRDTTPVLTCTLINTCGLTASVFFFHVIVDIASRLLWESRGIPHSAAVAWKADIEVLNQLEALWGASFVSDEDVVLVDAVAFWTEMLYEIGHGAFSQMLDFAESHCAVVRVEKANAVITTTETEARSTEGNETRSKKRHTKKASTADSAAVVSHDLSKIYVTLKPRSQKSPAEVETLLTLRRLACSQLMASSTESSNQLWALACLDPSGAELTAMSPLQPSDYIESHPFVQMCCPSYFRSNRAAVMRFMELSAKHFSVPLMHTLLMFGQLRLKCPSSELAEERVTEALDYFGTAFVLLQYFDHRKLALCLKQRECPFASIFSTVLANVSALVDQALWDPNHHKHSSENGVAMLLFLLSLQTATTSEIASCKSKFPPRESNLTLDRYGVPEQRSNFDDGTDASDCSRQSERAEGILHNDDLEAEAIHALGALCESSDSGSSFDNLEEEDEDDEGDDSSEEENEGASFHENRRQVADHEVALIELILTASASPENIPGVVVVKMAATDELWEDLTTTLPLGENRRWLRMHPITSGPVPLSFLFDAESLGSIIGAAADPLETFVNLVVPLTALRSSIVHRMLGHIMAKASATDWLLLKVLGTFMQKITERGAHALQHGTVFLGRHVAIRIVHTVVQRRRSLATTPAAKTVADLPPHEILKGRFLRDLWSFFAGTSMSVLCQRIISYCIGDVYSDAPEEEGADWEDTEEIEQELDADNDAAGRAATDEDDNDWEDDDGDAPQADSPKGASRTAPQRSVREADDKTDEEDEALSDESLARKLQSTREKSPMLSTTYSVKSPHHPHPLTLTSVLAVPSYGHTFSCDKCDAPRCDAYSFRCADCQYDECPTCVAQRDTFQTVTNDDFECGGPYYQPDTDPEVRERDVSTTGQFKYDQFIRLVMQPGENFVLPLLVQCLSDRNSVVGFCDFVSEMMFTYLHVAAYPWEKTATQNEQTAPFLPRRTWEDLYHVIVPATVTHVHLFVERHRAILAEVTKLVNVMDSQYVSRGLPANSWIRREVTSLVYQMDFSHAEFFSGSQLYYLLPMCVMTSTTQQAYMLVDACLQCVWDALSAYFELITTVLSRLGEGAVKDLQGLVTTSMTSCRILAMLGRAFAAVVRRNAYITAVSARPEEERLHSFFNPLTCAAGPADLRRLPTGMMQSESELFDFDGGTPLSSARHHSAHHLAAVGGSFAAAPSGSCAVAPETNQRKSEILIEVISQNRHRASAEGGVSSRPTTAGFKDKDKDGAVETEDPWNEQRTEEIASVVAFAQSYRVALNFLMSSRSDPESTLSDGLTFLLNTSKMLDFSIRLSAFRTKMYNLHDENEDEVDLTIDRDSLLESTLSELKQYYLSHRGQQAKTAAHTAFEVTFMGEEAMDAGGVKREWLTLVVQRLIAAVDAAEQGAQDTNPPSLFARCSNGCFEMNPAVKASPLIHEMCLVTGMLLGLAVVYDIPVDLHLSRATYSHLIGRQPTLSVLEATDPDLFKNLKFLSAVSTDEEMEAMCLVFTAPDGDGGEVPLIDNGAEIPVTLANRADYIRRRADYRMTKQVAHMLIPFVAGFHFLCPIGFLQCFTAEDLELVSCGVSTIDVEDLRTHTKYEGYLPSSPQVRWFWEVCQTLTQQDLVKLVQFATASTRPPAGGFASLNPPLTLSRCAVSDNLPVAHTCMNTIDLPAYESSAVLREKLLLAITLGSVGFGLV